MQNDTLQSESQQAQLKTKTQAEQYADLIEAIDSLADDSELAFDNELARDGLLNQSRSHKTYRSQIDRVPEFADRSIFDCRCPEAFTNLEEFLEYTAAYGENAADTINPTDPHRIELVGTVALSDSGAVDLPLQFTEMRLDGAPYVVTSTDHYDEPADHAPIVSTTSLAKLVGQRIRVSCLSINYAESRTGTLGGDYHTNVPYLADPLVLGAA